MGEFTLAGAGWGVLTGGLGSILGRVFGLADRFIEQRQERARWAHELSLHKLQARIRAEETEQEIQLADIAGSWRGLEASLSADAVLQPTRSWVNDLRGATRPVLTGSLVALAFMAFLLTGEVGLAEDLTYLTATAVAWWFGDRARWPKYSVDRPASSGQI